MSNECILEAKHLSVGYKTTLISDINFCLKRGQLVALAGRNGCGKSTLLKSLLGIQGLLKGEVELNSKSILSLSEIERARQCAVVLTDKISIAGLCVKDIVEMGRQPYLGMFGILKEEDHKIVSAALKTMEIEHLSNRVLIEVSDGERQKCMIARAIAQDTALILMDEPLAFLDYPSKMEVLKMLRKLVDESGKSILFSTHELPFLPKIADEVWIIDENKNWITAKGDEIEPSLQKAFGPLEPGSFIRK